MIRKFLAATWLLTFGAIALAQEWPARPIKYIVPFPPGGATDIISRPIADKLRERLGQPVVIENIGGAGASIGTTRLKQAPPRRLHHRARQLRVAHHHAASPGQAAV